VLKAIDIWMSACLTFVFLGLLEFAYVNVVSRVSSRRQTYAQRVSSSIQKPETDMNETDSAHNSNNDTIVRNMSNIRLQSRLNE